jgi:hypothetical protein
VEGLGGTEVLLHLLDSHAHDAWEDAMKFMEEADERTRNYLSGLLFEPPPVPAGADLGAYAASLTGEMERRWKRQRMEILEQEIKSGLLAGDDLARKTAELMELWKTRSQHGAQTKR